MPESSASSAELTFTFNINLCIAANEPTTPQPQSVKLPSRRTDSIMDISRMPDVFDQRYQPSAQLPPRARPPNWADGLQPLVPSGSASSLSCGAVNNSLWESPVSSLRSNAKYVPNRYAHTADSILEINAAPLKFDDKPLVVPQTLSPGSGQPVKPSFSPVSSLMSSSDDSLGGSVRSSSSKRRFGDIGGSTNSSRGGSVSSSQYFSPRE